MSLTLTLRQIHPIAGELGNEPSSWRNYRKDSGQCAKAEPELALNHGWELDLNSKFVLGK